ncbi:MAG: hypothetical protein IPM53_05135 [Anaerolineaceae bacterium]|nr:hypothetical protein [Anaerolineaceae bacterium]
MPTTTPIDKFFAGKELARQLFEAVRARIEAIGPAEIRVSKSQIAFRRKTGFASVWVPGQYIKSEVPLVLTIGLRRRDDSPRWKEVVQPAHGRFTHHLELRSLAEIDEEVHRWLQEAWEAAA